MRVSSCISPERKFSVLRTVVILRKAAKCDNPAGHSLNTGVRNSDLLPQVGADVRLRLSRLVLTRSSYSATGKVCWISTASDLYVEGANIKS